VQLARETVHRRKDSCVATHGMASAPLGFMNKGKPSGYEADTKKDAGAKSTSYERAGQAGAGPEWTERKQKREAEEMVHAGGDGGPKQKAGGPEHRGGDAHEDRNP
jgi:hypothetical protein